MLETLDSLNKYLAFMTFLITFVLLIVLFASLRFRLDKAAIF